MSGMRDRAIAYNRTIKAALETILAALNTGQRKKVLRDPAVAALVALYEVEVDT